MTLRSAYDRAIMELMDELKDRGYDLISTEPIVYCKAFEDNSGALEIARIPKMRTRTKAINVIYHHFREYVRLGTPMIRSPICSPNLGLRILLSSTVLRYAVARSIHAWFERECEITRTKYKEK